MSTFYTKQELMDMPLHILNGLDIYTPEQQELVQEVVNLKTVTPPASRVAVGVIPDINTPEEERHWQEKIDEKKRIWEKQLEVQPTLIVDDEEENKADDILIGDEIVVKPVEEEDLGIKCFECGSRGYRHRRGCPLRKY